MQNYLLYIIISARSKLQTKYNTIAVLYIINYYTVTIDFDFVPVIMMT